VENQELRYHQLGDFDREMIRMLSAHGIYKLGCQHVKTDQADLVIAFERAGLLFVFNFHPAQSYTDYGLAVDAGKYNTLLCSDQSEFGGFDRFDTSVVHRTVVERSFGLKQNLKLYIPSRSAIVLQRSDIPRVR
jgi:1,4-alpha-glucan branching enzyme